MRFALLLLGTPRSHAVHFALLLLIGAWVLPGPFHAAHCIANTAS